MDCTLSVHFLYKKDKIEADIIIGYQNVKDKTKPYISHINIIKRAKQEGLKSVLVLEDDVNFININIIDKSVEQLMHKEWSLFYLGSIWWPRS